jgi:serine/threonine protein kinase
LVPHAQEALSERSGEIIGGRYQLAELIGRGGFGSVFAALDLQRGVRVALKQLHPHVHSPQMLERFSREAAACALLKSPNTVRLLDHGRAGDGAPFIVYELLSGRTLAQQLERGPLPQATALAITRDLLASLAEAHNAGIVHRDVKPANVFLVENGPTKLLDFGVAAPLSQTNARGITATGEIVGTPPYLAPEQLTGSAVSPATDLYAVAIVLAEMLTGRRVFDGPALAVMARKARAPFPPFDDALLASPLRALLLGASAKDPAARFQSAEEMLRALAGGAGVGLRKKPHKAVLIAAAAVAAVVLGGAVAYLSTRSETTKKRSVSASGTAADSAFGSLTVSPAGAWYCPKVDKASLAEIESALPKRERVESTAEQSTVVVYKSKGKMAGNIQVLRSPNAAAALKQAVGSGALMAGASALYGDSVVVYTILSQADCDALRKKLCP